MHPALKSRVFHCIIQIFFAIIKSPLGQKMNHMSTHYWHDSAELLFYVQKLQKGLTLPAPRKLFGLEVSLKIMSLLDKWQHDKNSPIIQTTHRVLKEHYEYIALHNPDNGEIQNELKKIAYYLESIYVTQAHTLDRHTEIEKRITQRRSRRYFTKEKISFQALHDIIEVAQNYPSACNRQPCLTHLYQKNEDIEKLLELQTGNKGFHVPNLLVVTYHEGCFFEEFEETAGYLHAGMFLSNILTVMESYDIASCVLNWHVSPETEKEMKQRGKIHAEETIAVLLAFGMAHPDLKVATPAQRTTDEILIIHK